MVKQLESEPAQFSIFCSNKDLDGTLLQSVAYDEWVQYSPNARIWYSTNNKILALLESEIKKQEPAFLYIIGLYDWNYNFKPLLHFKNVKKEFIPCY